MTGLDDSQTSQSGPILVVGAGPTGLMVAIELLRRNVSVRLIDCLAAPPSWSQAIFIKQRTLEILAGLGLVSHFIDEGQWVRRVSFYSEGSEFAAYDFEQIGSPYPNMLSLPESATIRLLTQRLHELGGRVEYGTQFIGLTQDRDGVAATIESAEDGRSTIAVPFLVGADGYRSAVREAISDEYEGTDYRELWGVFDTHLANWTHPRDTVCAQLEPPVVLPFPLGADRWRIYFRAETPGEAAVAAVLARLRAICPQTAFAAPDPPQYFHSHSRLARKFQIWRVFLAGDAAHASNPIQGHGMNAGIQDAHNLGWKLAAALSGHGTDALLRSYDIERRSVDSEVVTSGDEAYAWMTDATGEKLAALYAFLRTPDGKALAAIAETEIGYCYAPSAIITDLREGPEPAQKVGARVGDVPGLVDGAGTATLYALLAHPEPTVLLLAGEATDEELSALVETIAGVVVSHRGFKLIAVRSGDRPSAEANGVVCDPEGALHARFGASDGLICVIRPDGHVSLCCAAAQAEALGAHLEAMFCP